MFTLYEYSNRFLEVIKCIFHSICRLFPLTLGAILFLLAQCILLAFWFILYMKHKKLKQLPKSFPNEGPYRDFDPYFPSRRNKNSNQTSSSSSVSSLSSPHSSPEPSLDLVQRKLIMSLKSSTK